MACEVLDGAAQLLLGFTLRQAGLRSIKKATSGGEMAPHVLNAVTIDILVEQPRAEFGLEWLFPKNTFEQFMEQRDWMVPRFFDPEKRKVLLSIHSYVIRTKHHTILFDTCCGNHKERGGVYPFHMVDTPYLENLAAMGCEPEDIDYVMCSHLHVDHIGWNTRLQDGKWVPTFPKAKYLVSRDEAAYWEAAVRDKTEVPFGIAAYQDSVAPVIAAGQFVVVDAKDGAALLGDEFQFYPLLGHTPGHTGLLVESGKNRALLGGDALHSPIQFLHPEWSTSGDRDRKVAEATRRHIIETCTDSDILLMTGHFPAPSVGRLVSAGGVPAFRFV
jgi:glyoxylase-like metal-dependent hydrolase (beta-lactamase superfamily II)